jgi:hypothetical protein
VGEKRSRRTLRERLLGEPALRRALLALVTLSLVFLVAVANLIAVAEGPPRVSPVPAPASSWSVGRGTAETSGQVQWAFTVEPAGRRLIELDVSLPFRVDVDHHAGESRLFGNIRVWADGEQLRVATRHVPADGEARRFTESGDVRAQIGRIVLEREPGSSPFPVIVTWDWSYVGPAEATVYALRVGPVTLEPVALPGLPGCTGTDCARGLFFLALVAQGAGVIFFLRARDGGRKEAPGMTDKKK